MSVNKKYYYLKLKENFFESEAILLLESMQDGFLYSNILLKLYLKALKYEGRLQLNDNIPYDNEMIATITKHDVETVNGAIKHFLKLGLLEILPSGIMYCSDIELYVGKSSTEGDRKRLARQNLLGVDICPPELEKEIKKESDIELEKDTLRRGRFEVCPTEELPLMGEYQNVLLSAKELEDLKKDYPSDFMAKIENLSSYMASSGKTYQNHLATIRLWSGKESTKTKDYECEEGESL